MDCKRFISEREYTLQDLEKAMDSIPYEIYIKGDDGKYKYVNNAFAERLNLPKNSIIGKNDLDFNNLKDDDKLDTDNLNVIITEKPIIIETQIEMSDEHKSLETYKLPLYDSGDKKDWVLHITKETTISNNAEHILDEKLEEDQPENDLSLESLTTDFFANVSHEFKTPINIILTTIQLISIILSNYNFSDQKNKMSKYVKIIKQNSYRLLRLVNNLLDITKIESGYYELKPINCDVVNIIEDIILSVADYIGDKGRNIIFDTTQEEIILACDPEKIERIILNLLSNAIKYTEEDGQIEVDLDVDKENQNLIVSIKDNGISIDEEHSETIFDKFSRVDNILNRRCEGSGIGLSLVKSLVELHNGNVWVNTEFEFGAEIIFTIPIKSIDNETNICFHAKSLDARIERCNVEFSDIYSL